jgi:flagellar hook-associated protein 3 FlgL
MRITENRLMELAGQGVSKARDAAARAGREVQTGVAVERPSDDTAAWATARRAQVRAALSEGRGGAIARASEQLADVDGALDGIGTALARVSELGIQMSNGTLSAADRTAAAAEVSALRDQILAHASIRGGDGEYLLAGSAGGTAPFDATGAYLGDDVVRRIASGEQQTDSASVSGNLLTAASGVDVFAALDTLTAALTANDQAGAQASVTSIGTAIDQVATARTTLGARHQTLLLADGARQDLEQHLSEVVDRAVAADPIASATDLARAAGALESARAVAEKIASMFSR